ncbi:ribonuclease D [Phenylobacterium sp.]|uniref:ribonuclease D n=1 Tax=Phenylobacterium sp. TaxID=1871053 RepID=UPI0035B0335E
MATYLHNGDLPDGALAGATSVAVDSETMGLRLGRDPLCVVQLSAGDGDAHVVRLSRPDYDAPNLKRLLTDPAVTKIFHFGRFDIAMFHLHLGVLTAPVYCTKIASKLARTYTDRHGLKDVTRELLGVDMSKAQQSSDWGAAKLSDDQLAYAASDVLHLHALRARLDEMLEREGRDHLARACFDFLPHRAVLDVAGWEEVDIFAHA